MMMSQKPLMLKDYLELDWDSEPSGAGFRCAPGRAKGAEAEAASVRCLLDAELRSGWRRLPRTRSMSALTRISAVINAVKLHSFASAAASRQEGFLSRSFSRRLRGSFWKKSGKTAVAQEEEMENRIRVKDIVRLRSFEERVPGGDKRPFDFPSPTVSSCSSCSESGSFSIASTDGSEDIASAAGEGKKASPRASLNRRSPMAGRKTAGENAAAHRGAPKQAAEGEGEESPECQSEEEEKEQLSPVSVMDFPSEEDDDEEDEADDDTASPSFANLQRTKQLLLQKIEQFESLAELVPVNLDRRFAACDDDDGSESTDQVASSGEDDDDERSKAWGLLGQLKAGCHVEACVEKLVVDFFVQGLSCSGRRPRTRWASAARREMSWSSSEEEALLKTAREWVDGAWCGALEDYDGEATLREMEKAGRWGCFEEEGDELGVDLEGLMLGSLVEELVVDLVSC